MPLRHFAPAKAAPQPPAAARSPIGCRFASRMQGTAPGATRSGPEWYIQPGTGRRQSRARSAADRPRPWRCCSVCLIRTICRRPPHPQVGTVSHRLGTSPHVTLPHD
jgi:hypothetical protein